MPINPTPESILHELAQIQRMDRGTVSVIRQGLSGPCYNHQCYEHGRNVSRYVPRDQVPELKADLDGYHRFEALLAQYVQLMVEQTRIQRQGDSKKKPPRLGSSSRRRKKSNS